MISKNMYGGQAGYVKCLVMFLVFFAAPVTMSRGEKKDTVQIAGCEKIDPLDKKALDFLELDHGQLRLLAGRFAREKKNLAAAQCYLALLRLNPDDSTALYNLACCYGRLRRADFAVRSLVLAIRAGFRDFAVLKNDPDFISIRDTPEFLNLMGRVPDWEDNRGQAIYLKTVKVAELLVKIPKKIDMTRTYPLLIGLHGNGDNSENMLAVMANTLKKEPLILAAPQGAYANFPLLSGQHFSWEIQTRDRELWKMADPLVVENLMQAVQALKEKYPISKVYFLGFSQGAAYAFLAGFKYPGLAAGVISVGGVFPETGKEYSILDEAEIANGVKFRVFIAQGDKDSKIPTGYGAKTADKLKNLGYEVEYLEYEGGHEISPELLKKIYAWMTKG
ncbi:MAG TPA: hypothetical protein VLQ89_07835 [Candidatus Binatia bacterium]|nr:hypothetical protein [Candidatus Binatia bacterium]